MKTEEIKVGKTYTNGKGRYRKVMEEGSKHKRYHQQSDWDCLLFIPVTKEGVELRRPSDPWFGRITRNSFAKWAKAEVR